VTIGPTSVREALARLHSIVEEAPDDRYLRARVRVRMGLLMALAGHQREAVEAESEAEALLLDLGVAFPLGSFGLIAGNLELVLGRLDRAEQRLLAAAQIFERARERSVRSTALAALADVLARQGRLDEAESTAQLAIETGSSDDFATLAWAQGAIAMVLARREQPGAVEAARRAVTLVEQTDILWMQGEAWEILAAALLAHGHQADATAACNQALARYHRKGATALVARVRGLLAATPSHE
jgi:tetratricopeptide (TPR) repeat protein